MPSWKACISPATILRHAPPRLIRRPVMMDGTVAGNTILKENEMPSAPASALNSNGRGGDHAEEAHPKQKERTGLGCQCPSP